MLRNTLRELVWGFIHTKDLPRVVFTIILYISHLQRRSNKNSKRIFSLEEENALVDFFLTFRHKSRLLRRINVGRLRKKQKKLIGQIVYSETLWKQIFGILTFAQAVVLLRRSWRLKQRQPVVFKGREGVFYKWRRGPNQGFNRHHMDPKSRGGKASLRNLLRLRVPRHNAFHLMFKTATWEEVICIIEEWAQTSQEAVAT